MTLKELEKQLLALTTAEKSQVIQLLVQSLSNTWQGDVLDFAIRDERAILTRNWDDFRQLHRLQPDHAGIINADKGGYSWFKVASYISCHAFKRVIVSKLKGISAGSILSISSTPQRGQYP